MRIPFLPESQGAITLADLSEALRKRQKNDTTDAEAICEAVTRANMRFVETQTPEQQSRLMLQRTRQLFIRQQTSVINAIRAHLAEFGIVAPVGRKGVGALLEVVADVGDNRMALRNIDSKNAAPGFDCCPPPLVADFIDSIDP